MRTGAHTPKKHATSEVYTSNFLCDYNYTHVMLSGSRPVSGRETFCEYICRHSPTTSHKYKLDAEVSENTSFRGPMEP